MRPMQLFRKLPAMLISTTLVLAGEAFASGAAAPGYAKRGHDQSENRDRRGGYDRGRRDDAGRRGGGRQGQADRGRERERQENRVRVEPREHPRSADRYTHPYPVSPRDDRRRDAKQDRRRDAKQDRRRDDRKRYDGRPRYRSHYDRYVWPRYRHHDRQPRKYRWYPYRHHHHHDNDFFGWLAFTVITLAIIDNLNEQQQRQHERAMSRALEAPVGENIRWWEGGARGEVQTLREGRSNIGRYCREYRHEVTVAGESQEAYGTACRNPDGSWEVVD